MAVVIFQVSQLLSLDSLYSDENCISFMYSILAINFKVMFILTSLSKFMP